MKGLKRFQMQKFDCLDSLLHCTEVLSLVAGKFVNNRYELPAPIMFEFTNPMARFSCIKENREQVAKSVAETLYAFSGMNGSDFIWEFRGWEDPRKKKEYDPAALGPMLRFCDDEGAQEGILDYHSSNALRQKGTGFRDQLYNHIKFLKENKNPKNLVLQFVTRQCLTPIHQAWLHCRDDKLNIMVTAGCLDYESELVFKYVPIFSFLLQIISDLAEIEMGSVQFVVGGLYSKKQSKSFKSTIVNIGDFKYPSGGLCLRDLDTLMSIMIEFVSRLDESSLDRANPFEGDSRVIMWSDFAEVFRAWKAEKLGYKIEMERNFYHPQLRYIYKGEVV